jgi:hypothetical protein
MAEQDAHNLERLLIGCIGRGSAGPLVNLTDGGDGTSGYRYTPEQSAAHGEKRKGRALTPEWRAAISRGMKRSEKVALNVAKASKASVGSKKSRGWWSTEEGRAKQKANNRGHTGHRHSEETKARLREAALRQHGTQNEGDFR